MKVGFDSSSRFSRRQIALVTGAAVGFVALAAGGYVLGATRAPDAREAAAQRSDSQRSAFADARSTAMRTAGRRGRSAGESAGADRGGAMGSRQGLSDARAAVNNRVAKLQLAARRRSESESEIGGVDSIGGNGAPASPLDGSGGVLVVGDSLEVLTIPYLKKYLPGVPLTTNAVGGYNSFQIFDLFEESYNPDQSVIVFDSGTNDNPNYPEILAGRLKAVAGEIGNRCMVVPSIHGFTVDGVGNEGKNRTVSAFVASRPGTQSPDWAGAVASHPELMQSDDLHPIAEGADLRARLIAEGVKRCLQFG